MINKLKSAYKRAKAAIQKSNNSIADANGNNNLPKTIDSTKKLFYCPCCDSHFQEFVGFPYWDRTARYNPKRFINAENLVICPICASSPRHRILVYWMKEHIDEFKSVQILHFAQEACVKRWFDENGIESTSADLFLEADLQIDIEDTGIDDACIPVIICNHVLEHVSDYKKALRELHRILKDDGILILSVPIDMSLDHVYEDPSIVSPEDRYEAFGQVDHVRVFGRNTKELFEAVGFDIEVVEGDTMPQEIKPVIGAADYDVNFFFVMRKRPFRQPGCTA